MAEPDPFLEQVVRGYLTRVALRWVPLGAVLLAVVLVVALVPPSGGSGAPVPARSGASGGSDAGSAVGQAGSTTGTASSTGAAAGSTGGSAPSGSSSSPSAGASGTTGGPAPTAASGGSKNVSKTGVTCAPGARQFPYSRYAPMCVAAFHGSDGGVTSPGVTATTITLVYRNRSSGESAAVTAATGAAEGGTDAQYVSDMHTYIRWFNSIFELYGRKVVLKAFNGQGDYLEEDQGQDLAATQADAVTAKDMGAFADVSLPLGSSTEPYEEDLAREGIISLGSIYMPQSWFAQFAPYVYSAAFPTGTQAGAYTVDMVCNRMAGMPAVFSGSTLMQKQKRVFGLITPENPIYMQNGDQIQNGLSGCGVKVAKRADYAIDIPDYQQEATNIVAQMKAAGVTTILCGCDPLFPIFATDAANAEDYYPEWVMRGFDDPLARLPSSQQMSHAIANEGTEPAKASTEAYQNFERADPGGQPAEIYFQLPYVMLLFLFDALQDAGPDLTPQTFQKAVFSMPSSLPGGQFGPWASAAGKYSPFTATQVGWWDPDAVSGADGKKGAWQSCDGGQWFSFSDPDAFAPSGRQLDCFGLQG